MSNHVRVVSMIAILAGVAAAADVQPQAGMKYKPLKPAAGPAFSENVLEMTPETLDRFGKALAAEEGARKAIAAKAAAPQAKPRLTKEQYQQCQMTVAMSPEYAQLIQDASEAASSAKDPAAQRQAMEAMTTKSQALMEKQCGPDPSARPKTVDVSGEMRRAQESAAKESGFTQRQYAILKERVSPLCLSDPVSPGPNGLQLPGQGSVFYVYSASEVESLRPRCEALLKSLYPNKR